ncbi:hypothetical protein G195_001934 [Phytophthora kernoviae 00238/432]|uniref:Glycosyltransferase 2-like domain-containing protein n=1 Tax=Phytophthora kernoviae 00238/432 TaxID=1284355 RepID=A0A8J4SM93_9STRA|nr:hypothetical protein G195_001934 [Phytophthora kernoviae 00238/432]
MLDAIFVTMQVILALLAVYQFTFSLFGLIKKKKKKHYPATKSFAVLVAAHNEEQVIGALMENLKQLDYPEDLYDVFVICDNCTDGTAQIVRQHVVMFDADNLVDRNFLLEMNDDLCNGSRVIQGYIDTKNPEDSWITAAYGVSYWYINRLWQLSRHNLNMANFLGGTGMCFETNLLKEIGWGATSLVEDLEFTMRSVQRNVYPVFNYDAKVFDEKPLTFKASARQRLRWMQGHFTVARRYFFPLLWQSIKERSLVKFDLAVYGANVGPHIANIYGYFPLWVGFVAIGLNILTFLLSMALEKVTFAKVYLYLILFPIYLLSWYPITFYAFFTQNNKQWSHTQHTRVVRLDEVQSKQG